MKPTIRALGLFSGGLDSMLAATLLRRQGIEVVVLTFVTPFFGAERARESAAYLGLAHLEQDLTEAYYPLLVDPPHGFGRYHNPCVDCHLLMLKEAGALLEAQGFHFLFTGEVLGQRPMSQHRGALTLIARESGYGDLILRPLSAQLLPPTRPELMGWVDREQLLNLSGRGRKRQMELAAQWGISRYPSPAGGCLLTDPGYASRLKDLLAYDSRPSRRDLELLKWGRHFRLPDGQKVVVGRTQRENEALSRLVLPGDLVLKVEGYPGPLVLIPGGAATGTGREAALLAASYSDAPLGQEVAVTGQGASQPLIFRAKSLPKERLREWLI